MQRIANLVDLEKCFQMSIWLQESASIQARTSPSKFDDFADDLAGKSRKTSVSNSSTKQGRNEYSEVNASESAIVIDFGDCCATALFRSC